MCWLYPGGLSTLFICVLVLFAYECVRVLAMERFAVVIFTEQQQQ